jgi:hypothetical protein
MEDDVYVRTMNVLPRASRGAKESTADGAVVCPACSKTMSKRAYRTHTLHACTPIVSGSPLPPTPRAALPASIEATQAAEGCAGTIRRRLCATFSKATITAVQHFVQWVASPEGYSRSFGASGFVRVCASAKTIKNIADDICFILDLCQRNGLLGTFASHRLLIDQDVTNQALALIERLESDPSYSRLYNLSAVSPHAHAHAHARTHTTMSAPCIHYMILPSHT